MSIMVILRTMADLCMATKLADVADDMIEWCAEREACRLLHSTGSTVVVYKGYSYT